MRIALFDYRVIPTNPVGGCHRQLLAELCEEHDFTVFAVEFDNPRPDRITWVRVPVPVRPLALLFIGYHIAAPVCYFAYRIRRRARFDLVQTVESNVLFGDVCYAHFCHRHFLRLTGARPPLTRPRGFLRWLDHRMHAALEPQRFSRARDVVVPSQGLRRELRDEYATTAEKTTVIPNPIDFDRMRPPPDFDRPAQRARLGLAPDDIGLVFIALGQFERKGLPLLLEALRTVRDPRLRLIVVGGEGDLVRTYERKIATLGLSSVVTLLGLREDVRPFLWAADAFVFPSAYEVFPLVAMEAAAAGLPLLATGVHEVAELIVDGENGFLLERSAQGVTDGLRALARRTPEERREMGRRASMRVQERCGIDTFLDGWARLYRARAA